ncbi:MAG: citrate/2-methylcitrate synthase [Clostridium sp.]|nr:citrate/2-methylcitrate synthase [Clostridium sp.]MCM1399137.1 citrate/2-methylcitrate synthase [Clostridium sp.]MCM1459529.1 citrate/2-methylcitrate synthase [Bacteroides sp.]
MAEISFDEIIDEYVRFCNESGKIDLNLYEEYNVKRGLRDSNGRGVLTGLTEVSDVVAFKVEEGKRIPIQGELYFQGYEVKKLVEGFRNSLYGFEEATYLLLFGELPTKPQLESFVEVLEDLRQLPESFNRDVIMKAPSNDMMNVLQKCVLTLYSYDANPNDLSIKNVLMQCLKLIAQFPVMAAYGYQAYRHYYMDKSLVIHRPKKGLSTAENILRLLRTDGKYTELEAKVLDVCLVIHAEHGGGNNSTFTTHVLSSTGTDTYSAVAASLGSLKGPRHGGANLKVQQMFDDLKSHVKDWQNEDEITDYLQGLLDKKGFDKSGLIYGMGHAVYSESDPRAVILKKYARKLSEEKGLEEEFALYDRVETIAARLIAEHRKTFKTVSANVDFYSGFVYTMLKLPIEIFTPIFAISRISGWSAHRIEELVNKGKIIRPAYKFVGLHKDYVPIEQRKW